MLIQKEENQENTSTENKPKELIKLRDYQEDAIKHWLENDRRGILKFATGAGKTITAIFAIREL